MTAYTCPTHGEYIGDDELVATFISRRIRHWCPQCSHDHAARKSAAQIDHDARCYHWEHWAKWSDLPRRYRNRTIANWRPAGKPQAAAGKLVQGYASSIRERVAAGDGLTLSGPPGTGKTHLACGIVSAACAAGVRARYVVWPDAVDRHKATFRNRDSEDASLLEQLRVCELLVLDEIGIRTATDFDQSLLFELIDKRYSATRSTIVATNLTPDALDSIGERTADRLREMNAAVVIPGVSQRQSAALDEAMRNAPPAFAEPVDPEIMSRVCIDGEMQDVTVRLTKPN